jgi:uncharacterized protein (TIGR02271 family)
MQETRKIHHRAPMPPTDSKRRYMMVANSRDDSGMLTGLFYDRESAERAYQGLSDRGYTKDDVNLIMSDETRKKHFAGTDTTSTELGTKAAEGAGIGGAVGGTVGATLAAVAAVGTNLVIPGLGLVVAGPLAAAAAGAGAGAATGGLLGALVGWGIPEERVKHYESGLKKGGILMGIKPRSEEDAAYLEQHWRNNNAQHIYRPGSTWQDSGTTGNTVVGVYDDYADARSAVQALLDAGFAQASVQLNPDTDMSATTQTTTADSGRAGGTGIGNFFNSLFGTDEHKEHRDVYAESVRRGSYVLSVDARNDEEVERASEIMDRFNAVDIDERSGYWKKQGWSGYDAGAPRLSADEIAAERSSYAQSRPAGATGDTARIPVVEEELKVGKRQVQRGGVRVFQRVKETPVHESVQLRKEQVKVERRPVDKPASEADLAAFKEGSIEMRETSEEAVVSKSARVVEEVVVSKEVSERTEEINDTVRKTDVEVEQLGASGAARGGKPVSDDADYRRHWQTAYGQSGGRYEDYDAAYRYGTMMAGSDRYKNYQWSEVEPQLRSDWESSHPESTWEKVKDAVRYGAERVTGKRH